MAGSHAIAAQAQDVSSSQLIWLLVGDVADIVDDGLDPEGLRWLVPVLEALGQQMATAEQQDSRGGYLSEVLEISPNWFDQVESLHRLRDELRSELTDLIGRIRETPPLRSVEETVDPFLARALSAQLVSWVDRMTTHHRAERELCQSVWYLDLGDGD